MGSRMGHSTRAHRKYIFQQTTDRIMDGIIPESNHHSFQLFLKYLEVEWKAVCLAAGEGIVRWQVCLKFIRVANCLYFSERSK